LKTSIVKASYDKWQDMSNFFDERHFFADPPGLSDMFSLSSGYRDRLFPESSRPANRPTKKPQFAVYLLTHLGSNYFPTTLKIN